jgi:two-component system alkaline phosphatase synthesis response regulator PhoP
MNPADIRILIVDDEEDIREILEHNLRKEGFQVETAENGKTALSLTRSWNPHLILMDVMMPEMDGMETTREIRVGLKNTKVIIAFLTARGEDYSQISGFESGADDYITKPIKPRVLISRLQALLRRLDNQEELPNNVGLRADRAKFVVFKDGQPLQLPKKEFELIDLLMSKPGHVFTRLTILNKVWGEDVVVGDRTIDVHIRKIRAKLGIDCITTVKGVGYKFDY